MQYRWLESIPDEIPWEGVTSPAEMIEVEELHTRLKLLAATNNRLEQSLHESGFGLDPGQEIQARMKLLTDMLLGVTTIDRMSFELKWQELIEESLQEAAAVRAERKRSRKLHLPNGKVEEVPRKEDDSEG